MIVLWALVTVPAVVGALLCLAGRRADRLAAAAGVSAATVGLALAVVVAAQRPEVSASFVAGTPFALAVDGLSGLLVVTVTAVTAVVLVFSSGDVPGSPARFHGLMLIFTSAVLVTATATTLPALLAAWELMGATSYALIGFWWQDQRRVSGGATAFLTTRAADLGLYAAAAAALAGGGGLALVDLPAASPGWRHVTAAGVLVAALGKAAQLPFSFWLSRAMAGPSPVSALLHSAAMVAMGGYLLLRTAPLLEVTGWAATTAAWTGAATALLLGAVALAQRDLKQLLAASTAAQLGFVVAAAGVGSVAGGAAQLVAHAATKALLFLVAGAWLSALGTKQLRALRGAARRWPLVGVTAGLGLVSLAGVPPLALWATKDQILAGALDESVALYVVLLAGAALSAGYAGKVLVQVCRPATAETEGDWDDEQLGTRRIGWLERLPLLLLAVGASTLGMLALPPVGARVRKALDAVGERTAGPMELVTSAAVAVVVLALVAVAARRRWSAPVPTWAAAWWGLEVAAHTVVVRPVVRLAQSLARFDDGVLDRAVMGVARTVASAATGLARADDQVLDRAVTGSAGSVGSGAIWLSRNDTRGIDAAVEGLARAVRAAGRLARRPQSGQLHHYYLQAVAVIGGSILLLLVAR